MSCIEQEVRTIVDDRCADNVRPAEAALLTRDISALLTRKLAEAAPPAGDLEEIRGRVREAVYVCVPSGTHDSILPVVEGVIECILPIVEQLAGERDGQEARAESAEQYAATLESDNGRILAEKGRAVQERDAARARAYSAIEALSVADDVTALEACCAAIGILNGTDPIADDPQPPASDAIPTGDSGVFCDLRPDEDEPASDGVEVDESAVCDLAVRMIVSACADPQFSAFGVDTSEDEYEWRRLDAETFGHWMRSARRVLEARARRQGGE